MGRSVDKIEVNGREISDIHDLTKKVERIAIACGIMASIAIVLLLWAIWKENKIAEDLSDVRDEVNRLQSIAGNPDTHKSPSVGDIIKILSEHTKDGETLNAGEYYLITGVGGNGSIQMKFPSGTLRFWGGGERGSVWEIWNE